MNLSKIKREEMLDFLELLRNEHTDDESMRAINEIEYALTEKKYGLVWEEYSEKVDEMLEHNIPVFVEQEDKKIVSDIENSFNFLLEGDNLHSLKLLEKTRKGKIDVIYIDPPYNTGNKDFIYNDKFVDRSDGYSHSKWLSFMSKRLEMAKKLLSDKGIVFISIDDNEQAQLRLLCDQILSEENFIAQLPTIMNLKGNQDQFGFAGTHEYTFVYAKNKSNAIINQFKLDDNELKNWIEDEKGLYKKGATLKRTGQDAPRNKRPYSFYPILEKENEIFLITKDEYKKLYNNENKTFNDNYLHELEKKYNNKGFNFILPIIDKKYASWRWGYEKACRDKDEIIITKSKNGVSFYKKQRPKLSDVPTKKPKTLFYKPEYSSGNGTSQMKKIFGKKVFDNPKPLELIKDFIILGGNKNATVLDFFAGSGTTGHAVAALNKEDGGNRKYILCTNNENDICEEVTYERMKNIQEELPHNLKYMKTDFIPKMAEDDISIKEKMIENIIPLIELEHGVEVDGVKNIIILEEEKVEDILVNALNYVNIYIDSSILLSQEEKALASQKNITIIEIPEYYYRNELREVGEI